MAREVTHEATGPLRLDESDIDDEKGDVAVCLCGLSDDYPFCDGSHRATEDEEEGVRYKYENGDEAQRATNASEERSDPGVGERREIAEIIFADDGE